MKDDYIELSYDDVNIIREKKPLLLTKTILDFAIVELYILCGSAKVESPYAPIKYGRYYGSVVFLEQAWKNPDINPKFIWNGSLWILNTHGNFVFGEIEINGEDSK